MERLPVATASEGQDTNGAVASQPGLEAGTPLVHQGSGGTPSTLVVKIPNGTKRSSVAPQPSPKLAQNDPYNRYLQKQKILFSKKGMKQNPQSCGLI